MKFIKIHYGLIFFCLLIASACNNKNTHPKILIATASNMKFAMEEITEKFTKETGIQCGLVISSSGQLAAQIKEKAPYDVFVSADMEYPNEVYKRGFAVSPPEIYARGKLVLWTKLDEISLSVDSLSSSLIRNIALPNPRLAPYGAAAIEVMKNNRVLEKVENKLIFGQSISQTDQFILTKSAEIGFTALSTVLSPKMNEAGKWVEIDEGDYSPIEQGVVVVKRENVNPNAHEFYNYLFSSNAKEILNNSGYFTNE